MSVVLMYHALYRDDDVSDIDQEDLPYAVSEADFVEQLECLKDRQVSLYAQGKDPEIVITFDDGHRSNVEIAAPLLLERGLSAYFFITSEFIGKRSGFMTEAQLRSLAELPGMCIGSHGVTHRFFDDMNEADARFELEKSCECLASITGKACQSISFPGGRYNQLTLQCLAAAGYRQWFGSDINTVENGQVFSGDRCEAINVDYGLQRQARYRPIERVAVRRATSLDEFARMIEPDERYFRHHRRRALAKSLVRRLLGNRLYHGLYKSLSAR